MSLLAMNHLIIMGELPHKLKVASCRHTILRRRWWRCLYRLGLHYTRADNDYEYDEYYHYKKPIESTERFLYLRKLSAGLPVTLVKSEGELVER